LPEGEREVLRRATALDPEKRYASCKDMIRELERICAGKEYEFVLSDQGAGAPTDPHGLTDQIASSTIGPGTPSPEKAGAPTHPGEIPDHPAPGDGGPTERGLPPDIAAKADPHSPNRGSQPTARPTPKTPSRATEFRTEPSRLPSQG